MFKPDRVMAGQLGLPRDFKKHLGARTFVINILFFCLLLCLCMYFSFFPALFSRFFFNVTSDRKIGVSKIKG